MCGSALVEMPPVGALVEGLTGGLMSRRATGEKLPASHDDIDISGVELETAADAAGQFGGDQTGARAEERVVNCLAWPGVVDDRAAHALDRLLGAVSPTLFALPVAEWVVV